MKKKNLVGILSIYRRKNGYEGLGSDWVLFLCLVVRNRYKSWHSTIKGHWPRHAFSFGAPLKLVWCWPPIYFYFFFFFFLFFLFVWIVVELNSRIIESFLDAQWWCVALLLLLLNVVMAVSLFISWLGHYCCRLLYMDLSSSSSSSFDIY